MCMKYSGTCIFMSYKTPVILFVMTNLMETIDFVLLLFRPGSPD